MEMVQTDRIPTAETLGHNENRMPPKTKEPNLLARSRIFACFCCLQIYRSGSVIAAVITFHTRSGWLDARSVQHQVRDMLASD